MVATHIETIKHSKLCVTGVYLRDITNTIFVILHLKVSRLSICSSCVVWAIPGRKNHGKDDLYHKWFCGVSYTREKELCVDSYPVLTDPLLFAYLFCIGLKVWYTVPCVNLLWWKYFHFRWLGCVCVWMCWGGGVPVCINVISQVKVINLGSVCTEYLNRASNIANTISQTAVLTNGRTLSC